MTGLAASGKSPFNMNVQSFCWWVIKRIACATMMDGFKY